MNAFDSMLLQYKAISREEKTNALREVMQQIVLAGLSRSDFFEHAAFYGGTCLRLFYGLPRFSEDMDFSLLRANKNFDLQNYFSFIEEEFLSMGKSIKQMKFKINILPPLDFETENKLLLQPFSFNARCFTLPCLFAGKVHAFLFRNWKNRVKGRDWFDFEWYVQNKVPLNLKHFMARAKQFGDPSGEIKNEKALKLALAKRIRDTDINAVKNDIMPFLKEQKSVEIWGEGYFLELAGRLRA